MTTPQKTVLITGGAGGLGKAIALAFLASTSPAYNVVIVDINKDLLSTMSSSHPAIFAIQADLTLPTTASSILSQILERFSTLDILVNNAGIMDKFDPVGELDLESGGLFERLMSVNVTAPTRLSQVAIQYWQENGRKGSIVNVGSAASLKGGLAGAAYTISKHALLGLTRATAAYYATRGVRCNIILPGAMETNISSALANGLHMEGLEMVKRGMATSPGNCDLGEVARLVVLLGGEGVGCVNGAVVNVDGGWGA